LNEDILKVVKRNGVSTKEVDEGIEFLENNSSHVCRCCTVCEDFGEALGGRTIGIGDARFNKPPTIDGEVD
jgi:hypothetical protein